MCLGHPPPHRCHFPGAPCSITEDYSHLFQSSWVGFFSAFHEHTLLYFCSAVTNRGQLQNIPQKNCYMTQKMERFMFAIGQQQSSNQQHKNLREALRAGFALLGSRGMLPALAALGIAHKELWDHFKETVIHIFRSQGHVKRWQQQEKSLSVTCHWVILIFPPGSMLQWTWAAGADGDEAERWAPTHQACSATAETWGRAVPLHWAQKHKLKQIDQAFLHVLLTHLTANIRQTQIITATLWMRWSFAFL